jgi:hypothetical protein
LPVRGRARASGHRGTTGSSGSGAASVRELARRVGRSHTAVTKWLADPRFPVARRGPWDAATVARIREWAATTLEPDRAAEGPGGAGESAAAAAGLGDASNQSKAKLALTVEKVKALKQAREIKAGLYHVVADCEARRMRQIIAVRDELLNVAAAAPFDQVVRDWIEQRMVGICERFARGEV